MKLQALLLFLTIVFCQAQTPEQPFRISRSAMATDYIVVFKNTKNNRALTIKAGKHVKTFVESQKGKWRYKKAVLTSVGRYKLVFTPMNAKFKPVEYDADAALGDEPLEKISFTSPGSIIKGSVFHLILGGTLYVVANVPGVLFAFVLLNVPLLGRSFPNSSIAGMVLSGLDNKKKIPYPGSFREHIDLRTERWTMHVVSAPTQDSVAGR